MLLMLVVAEPVIAFASPLFGRNRRRAILAMALIDQAPGRVRGPEASARPMQSYAREVVIPRA